MLSKSKLKLFNGLYYFLFVFLYVSISYPVHSCHVVGRKFFWGVLNPIKDTKLSIPLACQMLLALQLGGPPVSL